MHDDHINQCCRFVDAELGPKDERSKSLGAPYMLLLWTKKEESETFVSLCNQRRTLNLSRICISPIIDHLIDSDGN